MFYLYSIYGTSNVRDQAGSTSNLQTYLAAVAKSNTIPDSFFQGCMDEIALWNKALSNAEVTYLYNNGSGIFFNNFQ